jgi:hypothetical protein
MIIYLVDSKLRFWCHPQHLRALMPACCCNAGNCCSMGTVVAIALQAWKERHQKGTVLHSSE